jgi:hypothetical protein
VQLREELGLDAGEAMEVVCVLRDEEPELAEALELDEGEVGCVGLYLARWNPPPRRRQAGVAPRPHPLGAAKVGDAGVGADARAREGDDALAGDYPPGDRLDLLFETLLPDHGLCREATGSREDGVSASFDRGHAVICTGYTAEAIGRAVDFIPSPFLGSTGEKVESCASGRREIQLPFACNREDAIGL